MSLEALLVSRDPEVLRILRHAMDKLGVSVEVCTGTEVAREIISSEKLDAVIVDCDDLQGALSLLKDVRRGASNKNSIVFAILNGVSSVSAAFDMGANFVLQKPISMTNALRCFRAAHGFMQRERRRYFRLPVDMRVTLSFSQGQEIKAQATNLSEGGLALRVPRQLPAAGLSRVQFTLPGSNSSFEIKSELAWADGSGKAGIRFLDLPASTRAQLEKWMATRLQSLVLKS